ncbi:MAG TPA: hypothetical protein PLV25_07990, partial [Opitutales bacterium]|nr:hypothetical protein [Opitutales bacterium]
KKNLISDTLMPMVPQVIVDAQPVCWEGAAPTCANVVYQLVTQALAEQGRVLHSLSIDGQATICDQLQSPHSYALIEINSVSAADYARRLSTEAAVQLQDCLRLIPQHIGSIFAQPWSALEAYLLNNLEGLAGILQHLEQLCTLDAPLSTKLKPQLTRIDPWIEPYIQAIQSHDRLALAAFWSERMRPWLTQTLEELA